MSNITHPAVSEQLLVRIAAGDKAALAELYAQAKNPIYCFALSILRDSFAAEDVMQETFLQVEERAHLPSQRQKRADLDPGHHKIHRARPSARGAARRHPARGRRGQSRSP